MIKTQSRNTFEAILSAIQLKKISMLQLASKANISRTTLYRLLRNGPEGAHAKTLDSLNKALQKLLPVAVEHKKFLRYLEMVSQECGSVPLLSIPPWESANPVSMRDIFVPPQFQQEAIVEGLEDPNQAKILEQRALGIDSKPPERQSSRARPIKRNLSAIEKIANDSGIVVLASEAGGGKTTLLQFLAWAYASGEASQFKLKERWIPVLLDARRLEGTLRDNDAPLEDVINALLLGETEEPEVPLLKAKEPHLILVDRLDELETPARDRMFEELLNLRSRRPQDKYIISFRGTLQCETLRGVRTLIRLLPWNHNQQKDLAQRLVRHLCQARPHELQTKEKAVLHAIQTSREVESLCKTPLLLTLTILLFLARGSLSARRSELYDQMTDALLAGWKSSDNKASRSDAQIHWIGTREVRRLLEDWALNLWKDGLVSFPRARWYLYLSEALGNLGIEAATANQASEQFLELLTTRTGLLTVRPNREISFIHSSLAAHLTAGAIVRSSDDIRLLSEKSRDPRWREVVTLSVERLEPTDAVQCLKRILDDPDKLGRKLQRGLFLTLKCLAYDPPVYEREFIEDVFRRLQSLIESQTPGLYIRFQGPLLRMQSTRFHDRSREILLSGALQESPGYPTSSTCLEGISQWAEQEPQILMDWIRRARASSAQVQGRIRMLYQPLLHANDKLRGEAQRFMRTSKDPELREVGPEIGAVLVEESDVARNALLERLSPSEPSSIRCEVINALAMDDLSEDTIKQFILILKHDKDTHVRLQALNALKDVGSNQRSSVLDAITHVSEKDSNARIRESALLALLSARQPHEQVGRWLDLLKAPGHTPLKGMIIRKLERWSDCDQGIRKKIREMYAEDAPPEIRRAIVEVVGDQDHDFALNAYRRDTDLRVRELAAASIIRAFATGDLEWDDPLVREIEDVLWQSQIVCRHCWILHWKLLDARATLGMKTDLSFAIQQALEPLTKHIQLAFIFGSRGRDDMRPESDVDIFIVGDVMLGDIANLIRDVERTFQREINPVIRSISELRRLYDKGSAFIHDVIQRPKVFLIGGKDELQAMVGQRLVASQRTDHNGDS